jgi:hypothetical protein
MEFITDRHLWNKVGYQWNGSERNGTEQKI